MPGFNLSEQGITVADIRRNWAASRLVEDSLRADVKAVLSDSGALVAYSGLKTGRSPQDKRVVRNPQSEGEVWWGPVNFPLDPAAFELNLEHCRDYLNTRPCLYCVDAFAGWDPEHRVKVRVICARPYHALFMTNMLILPSPQELAAFGRPEYVIYNAGAFPASRHTPGMTSRTCVSLNIEKGELVILGTEYAGEMKKGVFTIMNYLMPKRGVLSMHCSATAEPRSERSALLFGLSGTGKTTLSADPKRVLIGDDEHCWTEQGIFNIEGGCYAKAIFLSPQEEPEIFQALRFGAVLENVVINPETRQVDFSDDSITENTRGAYPLTYLSKAKLPAVAGHPTDLVFLACDAFGVLPPVSSLTLPQAMYHFISGYTAKVAGTEVGITEPQATFSPCFGGPFLVWHPARYAELLAQKLAKHGTRAWLLNTGWSGGGYGTGSRIKLKYSRAILDAIYSGALFQAPRVTDSVFGFQTILACPQVPSEILDPRRTWADPAAYDQAASRLAALFRKNFEKFQAGVSPEVLAAGPRNPA